MTDSPSRVAGSRLLVVMALLAGVLLAVVIWPTAARASLGTTVVAPVQQTVAAPVKQVQQTVSAPVKQVQQTVAAPVKQVQQTVARR